MIGLDGVANLSLGNQLNRIAPEPRSSTTGLFKQVMGTVGTVADKAAGLSGISGDYLGILQTQMRVQQEMMLVSMYSNIEKSKHETSMAAVRNLRVG